MRCLRCTGTVARLRAARRFKDSTNTEKSHREVDVPLADVLPQAVSEQHHADEQQERQREHLDRGMTMHERAQGAGGHEHHAHGDHDRGHHHHRVLRHPDGGNDRIERKDDVEQRDLYDDLHEAHPALHVLGPSSPSRWP